MIIAIKRITERTTAPGTWVQGSIDAFAFSALIFAEHATSPSYELNQSRISKMQLNKANDGTVVYSWDRGLCLAAMDSSVAEAVQVLSDRLFDIVFSDERATTKDEATSKFPLGRTVITPNALNHLTVEEVGTALAQHQRGDWGNVCKEDHDENELSLRQGFRLLSVYTSIKGDKFWIITESDRSATTVLMPEDY